MPSRASQQCRTGRSFASRLPAIKCSGVSIPFRISSMRLHFVVAALLSVPGFALAQTSVKDALVKHWKTTGEFTIAVAKLMPADGYNFRPVPEEMSFGQLMVQIAGANLNACALASGMTRPAIPEDMMKIARDEKADVDRDKAISFLSQ